MAISQAKSRRKQTGALYKAYRKKRKHEIGRKPSFTRVAEKKVKTVKTKGGGSKTKILRTDVVNLYDPKSKKYSKAKVKAVLENPADRHFVRRNIMTKGAIIDTDKGKAKITSRPGQEGSVNAVLI